jgi:hypothetical protein
MRSDRICTASLQLYAARHPDQWLWVDQVWLFDNLEVYAHEFLVPRYALIRRLSLSVTIKSNSWRMFIAQPRKSLYGWALTIRKTGLDIVNVMRCARLQIIKVFGASRTDLNCFLGFAVGHRHCCSILIGRGYGSFKSSPCAARHCLV